MTFATMPTEFIEKYVAFNLHIRRRGICSAPKNREEEETISFLRSSPSYPFLKLYDDDLAASTRILRERDGRSFVSFVRSGGRPSPPAQKIKFSLCVTKSPPPPRRLLSLFRLLCALRTLAKVARLIYQT